MPNAIALTVSEELQVIQSNHGGLLNPVDVVEYARDESTALHSRFEWEDSKAAEGYRLWQARQIIRLEVRVIKDTPKGPVFLEVEESEEPEARRVRAYVSLADDRYSEEADKRGYRKIEDVMSDPMLTQRLLEEAKRDMRTFRKKYESLSSLAKVFREMDTILNHAA